MGSEIESLRLLRSNTQRSVRTIDEMHDRPLARAADLAAPSIAAVARARPEGAAPDAARERFEEELALLKAGGVPQGIDFYVPFLAPRNAPRPPARLTPCRRSTRRPTSPRLSRRQCDQAETSRTELEERGDIPRGLPSPLEPWPHLRRRAGCAPANCPPVALGHRRRPGRHPPAVLGARRLRRPAAQACHRDSRDPTARRASPRLAAVATPRRAVTRSRTTGRGDHRIGDDSSPERSSTARSPKAGGTRTADAEISLLTDTESSASSSNVARRRASPMNREAFLAELVPGALRRAHRPRHRQVRRPGAHAPSTATSASTSSCTTPRATASSCRPTSSTASAATSARPTGCRSPPA